jgi:HNH endonuclease
MDYSSTKSVPGSIMRYWWVNQGQTHTAELAGGFMWAPKTGKDGNNRYYWKLMRDVTAGDIIFSHWDRCVRAIGIATSGCREHFRPASFGLAGAAWQQVGWRVDVSYSLVSDPLMPSAHGNSLSPLVSQAYSPLQTNSGAKLGYLFPVLEENALLLGNLLDMASRELILGNAVLDAVPSEADILGTDPSVDKYENQEIQRIECDTGIDETTRTSLVQSRRGQGTFRSRVIEIEQPMGCRVFRVRNLDHLRASHIKPWRASNDDERLDGENGLLLTPSVDHLFDLGYISFELDGSLLVARSADRNALAKMKIPIESDYNAGSFTSAQEKYLEYHHESIFRDSRINT